MMSTCNSLTISSIFGADMEIVIRNGVPQGMRVNIQPAASIRQEDDAASDAALLRMKNTLSQGLTPSPSGINRRSTRANKSSRPSTGAAISPASSSPLASPSDEIPIATILESQRQTRDAEKANAPGIASPLEMPMSSSNGVSIPRDPPTRVGSVPSISSSQQNLATAASNPFENPDAPGLRASILETVNVLFQAGQVVRVLVTGEIGLSLKDVNVNGPLRIKIANFGQFDKSAPNNALMSTVDEGAGEFAINITALQSLRNTVTTVFKYQLRTEGIDPKAYVPIEVHPQWKIEAQQTSFIMTYHGNPSCQFTAHEESPFGADGEDSKSPPILHDVSFTVPVATGCKDMQTKPLGSYSAEKKRILWKMDDLDITSSRAAKILARFQTDTEGTQQPVTVQWRLPGRLASNVGLEVLGDSGVIFEEVVRATQSGKYLAQP